MSSARPYKTWALPAKVYWVAWMVVAAAAVGLDVKALLLPVVAAFFAAELPAVHDQLDRWPALTEIIGHYIPGWVSFPMLGLACWRLWDWIPEAAVVTLASWLLWHFNKTYESQARGEL